MKPSSEACERNRAPILAVLKRVFADRRAVLEIGSGTGQHAAYFAPALPHLTWLPSDTAENLPGIRFWREEAQTPGLLEPIELDVDRPFPSLKADAVFSANTCHIMSWPQVERMFAGVGALLPTAGVFALYGPFHYGGKPTAESNARFDAWLRTQDPKSGVRDFEAIRDLGGRHGLVLAEDNAMPANNRLLVFRKGRRASPTEADRNGRRASG
jgi:SAM-dependent methyltransferase